MQDERFTVKYITVNNCFVYLPEQWLRRLLSRPNVLRARHKGTDYYLSWDSRPGPVASDASEFCLSATFARSLNLKEGDYLLVSSEPEEPLALISLVVAPKTTHDREILELQSENVQANLLDQIRIVAKNQTIVAWVSKFLSVTLIVKSLNPLFRYGRLEDLTEIHVGDVVSQKPTIVTPIEPQNILESVLARPQGLSLPAVSNVPRRVYRVHPLPSLASSFVAKCAIDESLRSPSCVYVRRQWLPSELSEKGLWRVRKVKEDRQHVKTGLVKFGKRSDAVREFVVSVIILDDTLETLPKHIDKTYFTAFLRHASLNMSRDLMDSLRLKTGGKVILEPVDSSDLSTECNALEIFPRESFVSADIFRNFVARNSRYSKMLLNSRATVSLEGGTRCLVKLQPEDCVYGLFDIETLSRLDVRVSDATSIEDSQPVVEENVEDVDNRSVAEDVLKTVITQCKNALTLSLGLHCIPGFEYDRENILISGATGSGKTTVCKLLGKILSEPPYFTHTRFIDCKSLKGKKAEVIQKLLTTEISFAVYNQPTILFLDNIDCVTSTNSNTEENTPDSINAARITDIIFNIFSECQETNYISVIATCTDVTKVGKKLREARGVHFFRTILAIPILEKDERIKILRSSLQDKLYVAREIDWDHYGNKTEGWVAQDLVVLADKAAFTAWKRHVKERVSGRLTLHDADLSAALSRCTPISLHGVSLYRGAGHNWSDIGGLVDVKRDLSEILHWPLRYPGVFRHAPIKLQSGVLLYGMPGTGKTMLAGAIARECGLNLISVKGPELLSKYIGASEEAVRNVFEKAHQAKPCVLFFDEFDSLAPRRGHDSTGVTDRVVNQLLTHLDGIEGREGVAVVAASSRPDLLDPALLRPGRLDKALLCPLPDESDREEILEALCRTHEIDAADLDLKTVAGMTDGFTGADLNAILMQARLSAIEEILDSASSESKEKYVKAKVSQERLMESLKSTKPSLLAMEKEKYNRIYKKFAKSESYLVEELKHQKATLA